MPIYRIVEPGAAMTMRATDVRTAGVAVLLLGAGRLGALGEDGETPTLVGWDEWLAEMKIDDLSEWIAANSANLAAALDSFARTETEDLGHGVVSRMVPQRVWRAEALRLAREYAAKAKSPAAT